MPHMDRQQGIAGERKGVKIFQQGFGIFTAFSFLFFFFNVLVSVVLISRLYQVSGRAGIEHFAVSLLPLMQCLRPGSTL